MIRNKNKLLVSGLLALLLLLAGCGNQGTDAALIAAAETEAVPTPTPTVEIDIGGSTVLPDA